MKMQLSTKRMLISKANSSMFAILALASMVTAVCLVTVKVLYSENTYQLRVISAKQEALKQAKLNLTEASALSQKYQEFNGAPDNKIGGTAAGTGPRDGSNSKIILDALPSQYDFPALTTSLEGILKTGGYAIQNIQGVDQELEQVEKSSPLPEPKEMPFSFSVGGNYDSSRDLLLQLEKSIRPFTVTALDLSGTDAAIVLKIDAKTYFQPEKDLSVTQKEIR